MVGGEEEGAWSSPLPGSEKVLPCLLPANLRTGSGQGGEETQCSSVQGRGTSPLSVG